jgi:hypothetical protein
VARLGRLASLLSTLWVSQFHAAMTGTCSPAQPAAAQDDNDEEGSLKPTPSTLPQPLPVPTSLALTLRSLPWLPASTGEDRPDGDHVGPCFCHWVARVLQQVPQALFSIDTCRWLPDPSEAVPASA